MGNDSRPDCAVVLTDGHDSVGILDIELLQIKGDSLDFSDLKVRCSGLGMGSNLQMDRGDRAVREGLLTSCQDANPRVAIAFGAGERLPGNLRRGTLFHGGLTEFQNLGRENKFPLECRG